MTKSVLEALFATKDKAEDEKHEKLTAREKGILRLAAGGLTNREMAQTLFLSIRTVEKHRQSVMRKLGLSKREELTRFAIRKGLMDFEM